MRAGTCRIWSFGRRLHFQMIITRMWSRSVLPFKMYVFTLMENFEKSTMQKVCTDLAKTLPAVIYSAILRLQMPERNFVWNLTSSASISPVLWFLFSLAGLSPTANPSFTCIACCTSWISDFNFSCICRAIIFNRHSRILICRYNKRRTIIMQSPSHRLTVTVTVIICNICRPLNCIINYTHIYLHFCVQKKYTVSDVLFKP